MEPGEIKFKFSFMTQINLIFIPVVSSIIANDLLMVYQISFKRTHCWLKFE